MYLNTIQIENFRRFQSLNLSFNKGLNVLIGMNDSGKTSIIDAIKLLLGTHSNDWIKLETEDFYFDGSNYASEMKITCTLNGFSDDEAGMFIEWLSIDNGTYYLKLTLKAKRKIKSNGISEISYDIKCGEDDDSGIMNSIAKNKLRTTYLKPLRDAEYELAPRRGSRLSQILANYDIFQVEDNTPHDLENIMQTANEGIQDYFNDPTKGKIILDTINERYLQAFSIINNELSSKFGITKQGLGRILERLELIGISPNGGSLGLGSNNLVFIAAEMLLVKSNNYEGLKLSLIEEIEAHLHPQSQINLIDYLNKQSIELGLQSIITTHSNTLASKVDIDNLIICHDGKAYSLRKGETKLNSSDYLFLRRFLDDTKANLFFANGVIIVEGDAENLFLPSLAEFIGYPLYRYGVSIVNVGSTALFRYSKIFLRSDPSTLLNIPVAIINDLDIKPKIYFTKNPHKHPTCYQIDPYIKEIKDQHPSISHIDFRSILGQNYMTKLELEKAFGMLIPRGHKTEINKTLNQCIKDAPPKTKINLDSDLTQIQKHTYQNKTIKEQNTQYFICPEWTLEYVIGKSCLKQLFYESILTAKLILKSEDFNLDEDEYSTEIAKYKEQTSSDIAVWEEIMTSEQIAYLIYWEIMQNNELNKTSKAVVAQCLSNALGTASNSLKQQIMEDPYLKYLIDAIKYAANV